MVESEGIKAELHTLAYSQDQDLTCTWMNDPQTLELLFEVPNWVEKNPSAIFLPEVNLL